MSLRARIQPQHPLRRPKSIRRFPLWAKLVGICMSAYIVLVVYFVSSFQAELGPQQHDDPDSLLGARVSSDTSRHARQHPRPMSVDPSLPHVHVGTLFSFDSANAEAALLQYGAPALRKTLTAYVEPPMQDTVKGTGSQGDPSQESDIGEPPEFLVPLPLRTTTPEDLQRYQYPKLKTCHDVPGKIPVDRGLQMDEQGNNVVWNVGDEPTVDDYRFQEAPHCPVEADPYLPWIHDIFPSVDGKVVEFIAQNKRRCKTGTKFRKDLKRLEPQVALLQPVSVERIDERTARELAPELWHPGTEEPVGAELPRYRLAPFNESAIDGQFTRFVCRFHAMDFVNGDEPRSVIVDETLSTYPFNYEFVTFRKGKPPTMLTPKGKDSRIFWMSTLRFQCPVPDHLQGMVASGETILSDGTPTVHVDLIPLRTPPRFGTAEAYFTEDLAGPKEAWGVDSPWENREAFNPRERWGDKNVMPRVEASGRWENLPVCFPPRFPRDRDEEETSPRRLVRASTSKKKPHVLSACLWASASFRTRGARQKPQTDTTTRLQEWIEFHLMVGFDHIYVYDNSAAQTNETDLRHILDKFPKDKVTRIEWPSIVCNNNIPAHDNTGERSSQYASENSCRTRHAPFTDWIVSFDTDEYLVPMGNYTSLKDVLTDAVKGHTNILSFRSSRARLREDRSETTHSGRNMIDNSTFLEAYNCDSAAAPKPSWADRARKQIYRANYVPLHFVHYSTVTLPMLTSYVDNPHSWRRQCGERPPSERNADDMKEATMLHAKTTTSDQSSNWRKRCHYQFEKKWRGCYVGFPFPKNTSGTGEISHRDDGMEYNCYENERITNYWAPRLLDALDKRNAATSLA